MLVFMIAPVTLAAGIAGGASLLGGLFGNRGARKESERNRAFQERMRNTQWQAGVEDMRAAGLNPALAYSQGPAAAPSGSMASQSDVVTPAVTSGMQAAMARKQLDLVDRQIAETQARTRKTAAEASIATRDLDQRTAEWSYYFTHDGSMKPPMVELLRAQHGSRLALAARDRVALESATFSLPEQRALSELWTRAGGGGKGIQAIMPLLLTFLRSGVRK